MSHISVDVAKWRVDNAEWLNRVDHPPFTNDEWEMINTAFEFWVLECQMGRVRSSWPVYRYWKDAAPTMALVQQYSTTGTRLSDEQLGRMRKGLGK